MRLLKDQIPTRLPILFILFFLPFYLNAWEADCAYQCRDGGEISTTITIKRGAKSDAIKEIKAPTCAPGEKEYMWLYYSASSGEWKTIANSNVKNYQPDELYSTTYFLRCVRNKGCNTFIESNIVRVAVVDCMPSGIEVGEACLNDPSTIIAKTVYSTKPISYQWTINDGANTILSNEQQLSVNWQSEGLKKIQLQVIYDQCDFIYEKEVYVINCDCKGFYCRVSSSSNCGNGSARANGYGGVEPYRYQWSNGATTRRVNGLSPGTHFVTITDANGCACTRSVFINQAAEIECNTQVIQQPTTCNGSNGIAQAFGSGGSGSYCYQWSNGESGAIARNLSPGINSVLITDLQNGCSTSCNVTMESPTLNLSTNSTDANCGNSNGTATVIATGGSGDYEYQWAHGPTTASITALTAGEYSVDVVDNVSGCNNTASVTVEQNQSSAMSCEITISAITCTSTTLQSALGVVLNGGTGPYNYTWYRPNSASNTTKENFPVIGGIPISIPGEYSIEITDLSTGCTTSCSKEVIFEDENNFDFHCGNIQLELVSSNNYTCDSEPRVQIKFNIINGNPPFFRDTYLNRSGNCERELIASCRNLPNPFRTSNYTTFYDYGATQVIFVITDADGCSAELCVDYPAPCPESERVAMANTTDPLQTTFTGNEVSLSKVETPKSDARNNDIIISPNPFHESVNIMLDKTFVKWKSMEIRNVAGQLITELQVASDSSTQEIDLSHQPSGIYFLTLRNENVLITKRIIKQ